MSRLWSWCKRHTSEIIGAGLMLASSGLDGVYMALWMPSGWGWLGLVLNTTADVTDLYLGRRVGSLLRSSDKTKRWGALVVAVGQLIAIAYSWLFSYLQLRRVLPAIEGVQSETIAWVAAGFIPLLLAVLGIESGLSSFSTKRFFAESVPEPARSKPEPVQFRCDHPGCGYSASTQQAINAHQRAHRNGNGVKPHREREAIL